MEVDVGYVIKYDMKNYKNFDHIESKFSQTADAYSKFQSKFDTHTENVGCQEVNLNKALNGYDYNVNCYGL